MLKYLNPTFAEIARDKQTTGLGHVTKEDLKRLRVVVPPKTIETAFDMLMTPIFHKLQASLLENRTLAETRDYLLPRLISGEVRVGDAAQEIAA
jgi:type I restriction enzyme S subunit